MNVYFAHTLEQAPPVHCAGKTRGKKKVSVSPRRLRSDSAPFYIYQHKKAKSKLSFPTTPNQPSPSHFLTTQRCCPHGLLMQSQADRSEEIHLSPYKAKRERFLFLSWITREHNNQAKLLMGPSTVWTWSSVTTDRLKLVAYPTAQNYTLRVPPQRLPICLSGCSPIGLTC